MLGTFKPRTEDFVRLASTCPMQMSEAVWCCHTRESNVRSCLAGCQHIEYFFA